ncbi:MAG TPA: hypothetical protein VHM90_08000 [Phycisphaerae bacterium]|jgi:hypothetical protein|nr:hypothetical protein [Phycisphaerae bacterium]
MASRKNTLFLIAALLSAGSAAAWYRSRPHGLAAVHSPESLAKLLRNHIPHGWQMQVDGTTVRVSRVSPVDVYNGLQLPAFASTRSFRESIAPTVLQKSFTITLTLGNRMTPEQCKEQEKINQLALASARESEHDPVFMPTDQYWTAHPEFGHQLIPRFNSQTLGIYLHCEPMGAPWRFLSTSQEAECMTMLKILDAALSK